MVNLPWTQSAICSHVMHAQCERIQGFAQKYFYCVQKICNVYSHGQQVSRLNVWTVEFQITKSSAVNVYKAWIIAIQRFINSNWTYLLNEWHGFIKQIYLRPICLRGESAVSKWDVLAGSSSQPPPHFALQ